MLDHLLFGQVKNIVVIGTSQTLVTADDNVTDFMLCHFLSLIKVDVLHLIRTVQNICDRLPDTLVKGLHMGQLLAGLSQLGGGDEIHRIGDF